MVTYNKKIFFLFFLSFSVFQLQSQVVKFAKVFGGTSFESPKCVKQTFDKGYIVAGSTSSFNAAVSDVYLVKLDSMGVVKWQNVIGTGNVESGYYVIQTADTGYAIAGYTNNSATGYDVYIIKTDKNGAVMWTKSIGGANWDFAYHIQQTADLGYIIAGGTYSYGSGNEDGYLIKTDANGDTLWTKTFGGSYDEEFRSVKQTTDGKYICAGTLKPSFGEKENVYVVKANGSGGLLWSKSIGGSDSDIGYDIVQSAADGNYYVAGSTKNTGFSNNKWDVYFLKVSDSNGDSLLSEHYGTVPGNDEGYSICETASGRIVIGGYLETDHTGGVGGGGKDFYVVSIDNLGGNYRGPTFGTFNDETGYGVDCTKDGGFVIVGETQGYPDKQSEILILKTDSLGNDPGAFVVDNTVGIKDEKSNTEAIKIWMLEANNEIFLQVSDAIVSEKIKSIRICDMLGRTVSDDVPAFKNKNSIELSPNLTQGLYMITIATATNMYSHIFIKK